MREESEIWKDVKGYEGVYLISNLGNVKSLKNNKSVILAGGINSGGYRNVCVYDKGVRDVKMVHVLVAESFLDHKPCGLKAVIDHIDNNPLNNELSNLQIITHRENTTKDRKGGTSKYVGVSLHSNGKKYVAQCVHNNENVYLGRFEKEEEARDAYNNYVKNII